MLQTFLMLIFLQWGNLHITGPSSSMLMAMVRKISLLQKFVWKSGKIFPPVVTGPTIIMKVIQVAQYTWMEVFKKEADGYVQTNADGVTAADGTYPGTPLSGTSYGYSRHAIGDGGGFLFNIADVDKDGDLDIIAPQFFILVPSTLIVKGPNDPRGDGLCWFENPGASSASLNPWTRRTIDNWYTSPNPTGKGFEAVGSDIDNDGDLELVFSNHNHQDYKPAVI